MWATPAPLLLVPLSDPIGEVIAVSWHPRVIHSHDVAGGETEAWLGVGMIAGGSGDLAWRWQLMLLSLGTDRRR